jgi:DNA-binding HxlR family transcriptional regulator
MPTSRSYLDLCPIARGLDVVGERWSLLVLRELLLGAQRFSDLRRALPRASSNVLTDRLRELEAHGVVQRRMLPPPAASWIYELTERGRELESVLIAIGTWGGAEPPPRNGSLSATSILIFLRGCVRAHPDPPGYTYRIQLHDRVWTIASPHGQVAIEPREPTAPDASLETDPLTLNALLLEPSGLDTAIAIGTIRINGNRKAIQRLLEVAP